MSDENGGARTALIRKDTQPMSTSTLYSWSGSMLGTFCCVYRARRYPRGLLQKSDAIIGSDL
jgi:hypothetical protein